MARFPRTEADIRALGQAVYNGLAANATFYPAPPVAPAALDALLTDLVGASAAVTAAQAAATMAYTAKEAAMQALVDALKQDLRYAENTAGGDDAKLKLLGWGRRAPATPASALTPPGQPLGLVAPQQGEDWLILEWKAPPDGGPVTAYNVERRLSADGVWCTVGMSLRCGKRLTAQERGKEWEYRVIAVNTAGEGAPSNTVMAVL